MVVAIRKVKIDTLKSLYYSEKKNFFIAITVALMCIIVNPVLGLLLGIVLALVSFCRELAQGRTEVSVKHRKSNKTEEVSLDESAPARNFSISDLVTLALEGTTVVYRYYFKINCMSNISTEFLGP
jgi:MFS superfamily sulfate permease-like transporter